MGAYLAITAPSHKGSLDKVLQQSLTAIASKSKGPPNQDLFIVNMGVREHKSLTLNLHWLDTRRAGKAETGGESLTREACFCSVALVSRLCNT